MRFALVALALCLATVSPVAAQSFDEMLDSALSHWRAATWYARTGNTAVAGLEAAEFQGEWKRLCERFAAPPAQFAGDKSWSLSLTRIAELAEESAQALDGGDAPKAATALRRIGDVLAELRARNGIVGFSDHVARYRDAVERLSGLRLDERLDSARVAGLRVLAGHAADAVAELERNAPARWRGDAAFEALLRQNRDGVAALSSALGRPEPPSTLEIVGLIRVVRSNYYLLFLRFGAAFPAFGPTGA